MDDFVDMFDFNLDEVFQEFISFLCTSDVNHMHLKHTDYKMCLHYV